VGGGTDETFALHKRSFVEVFSLPPRHCAASLTAIKMEKARNVVRLRVASEILSTETSYANSLSLVSKVPPNTSRRGDVRWIWAPRRY
jgi:hypothetical protein